MSVIFLHPAVRKYRDPLFTELSKVGVDFLFTSVNDADTPAGRETNEILKDTSIRFRQAREIILLGKRNFSFDLKVVFAYDVIIFSGVTSIPFLLLAVPLFLCKKKILIFDELWKYPDGKSYGILRPLIRALVKRTVSSFVAAGTMAADFLVSEFKVPKDRIYMAYNTAPCPRGVNLGNRALMRSPNEIDEYDGDAKVVLYLGRVVEYKGLDLLIQAMATLPPSTAMLIVVGDGDFLPYCKRLCADLGMQNRIRFLGECGADDTGRYYAMADLFVLPAKFVNDTPVGYEAWGFTINEAMAMKLPVIATKAVGAAHDLIIDGETGWMCEANDVEDLSRALSHALNSPENLHRIGKKGHELLTQRCSYEENLAAVIRAIAH
jgi:glycosyltransferase involved in cell wall biosynthesis